MTVHAWQVLLETLRPACSEAGFDLIAPLRVGDYNRRVEPALWLETGEADDRLLVIIGNTRALWPIFLAARERDETLRRSDHPLDLYTERTLERLGASLPGLRELRFAHVLGEGRFAAQVMAEAAGLAWTSPAHLSVHPEYGPWIAWRAAMRFEMRGPAQPAPVLERPCVACAGACEPALARALERTERPPTDMAGIVPNWENWLGVRDACPLGRQHRYSSPQLRYHYTREARWLDLAPDEG